MLSSWTLAYMCGEQAARCCAARGRVGAFRSASTSCNGMCAVTDASGGIARANSAPGCNQKVDSQQSEEQPVLKSAPMGDTLALPAKGKALCTPNYE